MADENTETTTTETTETTSTLLSGDTAETPKESTLLSENNGAAETIQNKQGEGDKDAQGAPEKYADFSLPEGYAMESTMLGNISDTMKGMGLTQENAQKLIDLSIKQTQSAQAVQQEQWLNTRKAWISEIKSDSEFGGVKFPETVERAKRSIKNYGSEGFTKFQEAFSLGDNPEFIKFLARVDKATGEDTFVDGKSTTPSTKSAASVIYPSK